MHELVMQSIVILKDTRLALSSCRPLLSSDLPQALRDIVVHPKKTLPQIDGHKANVTAPLFNQ
jgi:hypothetical protein